MGITALLAGPITGLNSKLRTSRVWFGVPGVAITARAQRWDSGPSAAIRDDPDAFGDAYQGANRG
jgi:hypothetical protein